MDDHVKQQKLQVKKNCVQIFQRKRIKKAHLIKLKRQLRRFIKMDPSYDGFYPKILSRLTTQINGMKTNVLNVERREKVWEIFSEFK